ncbi:MAG: GtrA family protein [Clostridia bacterium]|nr:GtrA family protein [Clostridia bacterium]
MIGRLKQLYLAHREIILYVIFGGMTTLVDWSISFVLYSVHLNVHAANVIAWISAVLFAFVTNRLFVFESKEKKASAVLRELCTFSGGRVFTLLLQELIVFIFYDCLTWSPYLVKIAAAVLVIVLNYFISKFLVFRKGK